MIDPLQTNVQKIEDADGEWFWSGTLEPIPNIFAVENYEALVEDGSILDYDCALILAEAIDNEGPGPDYFRH